MVEDRETSGMNASVALLSALAVTFSTLGSSLYLIGFWSKFRINVFEYISASDIILMSVYPLFGGLVLVLFGLVLGYLDPPPERKSITRSKIGTWLERFRLWLATTFIMLAGLVLNTELNERFTLAGALLSLWIFSMQPGRLLIDTIGGRFRNYSSIANLLAALLLVCFFIGAQNSQNILSRPNAKIVKIAGSDQRYRYIGKAGDFFFLLSHDGKLLHLLRKDAVNELSISLQNADK